MENKIITIVLSSLLAVSVWTNGQVADNPENYWETFPDSHVDRIVVNLHTTDVTNSIQPGIFGANEQTKIKDFAISNREKVDQLTYSITGVNGVAGAKLRKHRRYLAQEMGTISFYQKGKKFDVTISNCGFFMGPDLNDFHLFYSWTLAKLINDILKKQGTCLSQEGFNALSGARSIATKQFFEISEGNWDENRFKIYKNRPANVWNILPAYDEWPIKESNVANMNKKKAPGTENETDTVKPESKSPE